LKYFEWLVYIALKPVKWLFDFLLSLGQEDDDIEGEFYSSRVEQLIERVSTIVESNDEQLLEDVTQIEVFLNDLQVEVGSVKKKAKGVMRGDIYFNGVALLDISQAISHRLENIDGFEQHYSKATGLWITSVLSIASHYHHLVGPAMIANGNAKEKIHNLEYSKKTYRAVVSDFTVILERAKNEEYRPFQEDLVSIECLDMAVQKLISFEVKEAPALKELSGIIASVLAKDKDPDIIEGPVEVLVRGNGRIKCPACNWSLVFSENEKYCRNCGIEHIFKYQSA